MKEPIFVSAVVYAYNVEDNIGLFVTTIDSTMHKYFETYEIIVVNDHSTDVSLKRLREAARMTNGTVIILNLPRKHGIERAMLAGLDRCVGDFIFEFDYTVIDYPVSMIYDIYKTATSEGYDIVSACSDQKSSLASRLFYAVVNRVSYFKMNLSSETFRLVTRRSMNAMLNLKEKVRYRKALIAYTGYHSKKIVYTVLPNVTRAKTKVNSENINMALDVILSFSDLGPRLSNYFSVTFLLFSLFMICYTLFNFFFNSYVIPGWTTQMILISTGFSGFFFILSIIGQYIIRILVEVQNRPVYTNLSAEIYKAKENLPQKTTAI